MSSSLLNTNLIFCKLIWSTWIVACVALDINFYWTSPKGYILVRNGKGKSCSEWRQVHRISFSITACWTPCTPIFLYSHSRDHLWISLRKSSGTSSLASFILPTLKYKIKAFLMIRLKINTLIPWYVGRGRCPIWKSIHWLSWQLLTRSLYYTLQVIWAWRHVTMRSNLGKIEF